MALKSLAGFVLLLLSSSLTVNTVQAHNAPALPDSSVQKPSQQFAWPFAGVSGPDTWLLGQLYGNTPGAFNRKRSDYFAGQGVHFGVDISARCGTPVLAIADGRVTDVDGPHGSPPHNVVIEHAGNLASLYGHLLERSSLKLGQLVKRGQSIGKSGDSQFTCQSAPHLHLEIRDASHQRFFNPILYLKADWDSLSLVGGFGRGYMRDLEQPRRWQSLTDQPQARRGGALLNNYRNPWPPPPGSSVKLPPVGSFEAGIKRVKSTAFAGTFNSTAKPLTSGGCCANPMWFDEFTVVFLDKPSPSARTGYYSVFPMAPRKPEYFGPVAFLPNAAGYFSPQYAIWPQGRSSTVEELLSKRRFSLPTGGVNPQFSSSGTQAAWTVSGQERNNDRRKGEVYLVSTLAGKPAKPRLLATRYGGGFSGWIDDDTVLLSGKRAPLDPDRLLETLNLKTGASKVLARAQNFRSISLSPYAKYVVYSVAFDRPDRNGQFIADTVSGKVMKLEQFGSVRWRYGPGMFSGQLPQPGLITERVLMIPLEPPSESNRFDSRSRGGEPDKPQRLLEIDASTGNSRELLKLPRKVTLDDWSVSPSGSLIVYRSSGDLNLYTLELP